MWLCAMADGEGGGDWHADGLGAAAWMLVGVGLVGVWGLWSRCGICRGVGWLGGQ